MTFGNEFWLILCQEYINSKLFAVSTDLWDLSLSSIDGPVTNYLFQMQGGPSSYPEYFFMRTSLGA
jgi:hypothetical protein